MSVNVPLVAGIGVLTVGAVARSVHVWRFGYRNYTDEQIQIGQDIALRLKVMNGRATAVFPFMPLSFLTLYLAATAKQAVHAPGARVFFLILVLLSAAIFLLSGFLVFTLKNRAWPKRLVPPRFRTEWVSLDSISRSR